jgi:hypothetical protein
MINNHDEHYVFQIQTAWIITREKIASTWLKEQLNCEYIRFYLNQQQFSIIFEEYPYNEEDYMDILKYNEMCDSFKNEWSSLKNCLKTKKQFIFLIRNPIHKFISGWIQDNIMRKLNDNFIDDEKIRLQKYFSIQEIDDFFDYAKKYSIVNNSRDAFPDVDNLSIQFKDIYEEFCFPREYDIFNKNIQDFGKLVDSGHPSQNLYTLWYLLFKNKFNIDTTQIDIIDIDIQDLEYTLSNKYNFEPSNPLAYKHTRGMYLKTKSYIYLSKHYTIINKYFGLQLFFWFEIISKLYEKSENFEYLKPISSYKEKYYIPDNADFFDIFTHMNWYSFLPESISLNYYENKIIL